MSSRSLRLSTRRNSVGAAARQTEREMDRLGRIQAKRGRTSESSKALTSPLNTIETNIEHNSITPKNQRSKSRPRRTSANRSKSLTKKPLHAILSSEAYEAESPAPPQEEEDFSVQSWMDSSEKTSLVSVPSVMDMELQRELITIHEKLSTLFKDQQEHDGQMLSVKENVKIYLDQSNRYVVQHVKSEIDNARKETGEKLEDLRNKLEHVHFEELSSLSKAIFNLEEKVVILQSERAKEEKINSNLQEKFASFELTKKKQGCNLLITTATLSAMLALLAVSFCKKQIPFDPPTFSVLTKDVCLDRLIESVELGMNNLIYFFVPNVTRLDALENGIAMRYPTDAPGTIGLLALTALAFLLILIRRLTGMHIIDCRTIAIAVVFYFIGMHS